MNETFNNVIVNASTSQPIWFYAIQTKIKSETNYFMSKPFASFDDAFDAAKMTALNNTKLNPDNDIEVYILRTVAKLETQISDSKLIITPIDDKLNDNFLIGDNCACDKDMIPATPPVDFDIISDEEQNYWDCIEGDVVFP
jgi:hypothetical protein